MTSIRQCQHQCVAHIKHEEDVGDTNNADTEQNMLDINEVISQILYPDQFKQAQVKEETSSYEYKMRFIGFGEDTTQNDLRRIVFQQTRNALVSPIVVLAHNKRYSDVLYRNLEDLNRDYRLYNGMFVNGNVISCYKSKNDAIYTADDGTQIKREPIWP